MAENFYTILTNTGKAKIANAQALGTTVNLTHLAAGDGNGAYYNPVETQTALVNEVWRGAISSIDVDTENPNWILIEAVIPTADGGFMVREVGVFDDAGDLIAVGKCPETYKPVLGEGSAKDLYVRMIIEVTNATTVTLRVDPAVVLATKKNVDDAEARAKSYADTQADAAAGAGIAAAGVVQGNLDNLAGAGRTTETVKGNADALATHLADYASPHQYEDEGDDPEFAGVKYRLVVINGEPFLEVVGVPE